MRKQHSQAAASEQKSGKGKKLLLPLAFSVVALAVLLVVMVPVVSQLRPAVSSSGLPEEASIPLLATPVPQQTEEPQQTTVDLEAYPEAGDLLGHLTVSGTTVDCDVYYGDSESEFKKGAGVYKGAHIPGEGGTILMGAHTNTYFRDFESAQIGADVTFTTDYGEYHYTITDMKVATDTDTTAYDLDADRENLIMYTCYPFGTLQHTYQRYFIYCDYVSGPTVEPQQP